VGREEKVGRGWDSEVDVKKTRMEKKMKMKMEMAIISWDEMNR
jgi:hypothetical protein